MVRTIQVILLSFFFLATSVAQQNLTEENSNRPEITKIGDYRYRLAGMTFDSQTREIFIPVTVNMREGGPIEYILVHENGKVHESIFVTKESPYQLQVILKLLKYDSGKGDVFNIMYPPEVLEKEGGTEAERGDAVQFVFQKSGEETTTPITDMMLDAKTSAPMTAGSWIITGSKIQGGNFLAEAEGSILAVYLDEISLFNMTRDGADNDERWGAFSKNIPEIGTQGLLILSPASNSATKPTE